MRAALVVGLAVASTVVAVVAGVFLGPTDIPMGTILRVLLGLESGSPSWQETVIWQVRLRRTLVGVFVGAGLAIAGAAMQGLFRNPLASPGVLGVSTGASFGAVVMIYSGLAAWWVWTLPLGAFAGGMTTIFVVYGIASRGGRTPIETLLLAGVAVGSLNGALVSFVVSIALGNYQISQQVMTWLLGGLDGRTWEHVKIVGPPVLLGAAVVIAYARDLDALLLGENHALSVGVDVARVRRNLLFVTAAITGATVAVAGAIGFVGLVIPHMLRLVLGPGHRTLLAVSLPVGAAFIVSTDLLARTLIAPEELRLGVITAAVGAPFFLWLLIRRQRGLMP